MKKAGATFELSATDLVAYLNCHHLTRLDRAVAEDSLSKPKVWDPFLEILRERGAAHEEAYIKHLSQAGLHAVKIDGADVSDLAAEQTLAAMKEGTPIIVQGALSHDNWIGRVDVLRRIESPSALGSWSYEAIDTKLARETKAGTILQLCLYSDLLGEAQGMTPESMHVVAPWSGFVPQSYRFAEFAAYFRKVKRQLSASLAATDSEVTYPDPKEHCDVCRWQKICDERRRADDHLCLVAGISKLQINEFEEQGVETVEALAKLPLPLTWKPSRGSPQAFVRTQQQARIQVEARWAGEQRFEMLQIELGFGFTRLPAPSPGDIFFDLEGDPFVGEHGLEYLFGYVAATEAGNMRYDGDWALSRADEKRAFENFVDFAMARWEKYPDLHIYHYAAYEPAALKRLMGRFASREEEIDRMLRAGLFVDLYNIVRHALRASVESYSIKRLEPFYAFKRRVPLASANGALLKLQADLELDDVPSASAETKSTVLGYNEDDCRSTLALRDWLESLRGKMVDSGQTIARPPPGDGAPEEKITEWIAKIATLVEKLTERIPEDASLRSAEQQAQWILANTLDWHRREQKAVWWEYFRLASLSAEELLDEKSGLSGLVFEGHVGGTARAPVHRYRFQPQESELRGGEELRSVGGDRLGSVHAISFEDGVVDIKKRQDSADIHPEAAFAHSYVDSQVLADALVRIGEYVVMHGIAKEGPYQAARDLLMREVPRTGGHPLRLEGETTLDTAVRLSAHFVGGVFPIQGPPGTGKTFTGARMICELVRLGKKVGVTANSHKVIRNLLDATIRAADTLNIDLHCCQKAAEVEDNQPRLSFAKRSSDLLCSFENGSDVGGGTAWLWAHPDAFQSVDVLFVDEAAQMSLANVLAVSHAAKLVVLLGDPQQLDQPTQGTHPDGTNVSALNHIIGNEQALAPDQGLFLDETWRLHPAICAFTSEVFYAGKLKAKAGCERQLVKSGGSINGSGLRYLTVEHSGNQNSSPEEASEISAIVHNLLESGASWVDGMGRERPLTLDDVLIITPYNAQVFEIRQHLPGARVGTVDKFQGQETPVAIYSTATSSHADAPRGMEFLYSLNRLNVASSRAKSISILVASPALFEAECRSPRQMKLVNAFCRYQEMADRIVLK